MQYLTLRQLQSMLAIEKTGKISTAANELGLTGPAITSQLKQLEEAYDLKLFDRTSEGMRPTIAGQAMLDAARRIQEQLRQLDDEIIALKTGSKGMLRLGAVATAKYFTPRLIAEFQKRYADINVELTIGTRDEIIKAISNHAIDLALMGRPPREVRVRTLVFGDHPYVIVAPGDHPLAKRHNITKEELAQEKFLIRERSSGTRMSLEWFFTDVPAKFEDLGMEMESNETIKQAVMAGLGIAFISAHTIEMELSLGRLAILDVVGLPIRRQWFSITKADRVASPAIEAFEEFLQNEAPRFLPLIPKTYALEGLESEVEAS